MVNNSNHRQNIYFPRSRKDSGRAYYISLHLMHFTLLHQILVISYSINEYNFFLLFYRSMGICITVFR